jgi:hypothetical protein
MDELRGPAGEVDGIPDIAAAAKQIRPPAVAHVNCAVAEREVERVLRVPGARGGARDVLLGGPGAGQGLCVRAWESQ